jgi:uncharacterized protein YfiM (DUF2279 family)
MENHHQKWVNHHFNHLFLWAAAFMAMLNNQRVRHPNVQCFFLTFALKIAVSWDIPSGKQAWLAWFSPSIEKNPINLYL